MSKARSRSIAKGIVAGLIGGIVATAVKNAVERVYPPRKDDRDAAPDLVTPKVGRFELTVAQKRVARQTMHWGLGAAAGAAYGAAAELYPAATSKQGASFGMALIALNQDNILPAIGLGEKKPQSKREHTSELVSFVAYGVVTETVRRIVRRMIR
jgi:putative membrane protein